VSAGNGIAGNINGFEYRILKMNKGVLPQPITEVRKDYYNNQKRLESHQASFPQMAFDNYTKHIFKPNLIYLWKLNRNKIELYLAIPKRHYLYAKTELKMIPNPITLLKQKETEGENKTNDVFEVDDINDLRRTNKTGTRI